MKRSKYGVSIKSERTWNGIVYHSKLELKYRHHLETLKKASLPKERVTAIAEQYPFVITINGKKICTYYLDFKVYYADGRVEYVDCKGIKTDIYRLKKKLVESAYPEVKIKEVIAGKF